MIIHKQKLCHIREIMYEKRWTLMYDDIPNLNRCQWQNGRLFQSMSFSFSLNCNTREKILLFLLLVLSTTQSPKIAWCTNIVRNEDDNVIQWLISNTTFNNGMWHVLNGFLFTKLYVNKPYFLIIVSAWKTSFEFTAKNSHSVF